MLSSPSVRLPSRNLQKFARKIKLKQSRVWNCVLVPTAAGVGRCKDQGQLRCCSGYDAVRGADGFQHPRHRIGLNAITWTTSQCVGPFLCCQASAVFFSDVHTHLHSTVYLARLHFACLENTQISISFTDNNLNFLVTFTRIPFFSAGRRNVG